MTHLLQSLDLTFFSSLKSELKKLIWNWQCDKINAGQSLNKYTVVILLHEATENCLIKGQIIENGFKRAGLFPWDPSAPDVTKLLPGTVFETGQNNLDINPVVETLQNYIREHITDEDCNSQSAVDVSSQNVLRETLSQSSLIDDSQDFTDCNDQQDFESSSQLPVIDDEVSLPPVESISNE